MRLLYIICDLTPCRTHGANDMLRPDPPQYVEERVVCSSGSYKHTETINTINTKHSQQNRCINRPHNKTTSDDQTNDKRTTKTKYQTKDQNEQTNEQNGPAAAEAAARFFASARSRRVSSSRIVVASSCSSASMSLVGPAASSSSAAAFVVVVVDAVNAARASLARHALSADRSLSIASLSRFVGDCFDAACCCSLLLSDCFVEVFVVAPPGCVAKYAFALSIHFDLLRYSMYFSNTFAKKQTSNTKFQNQSQHQTK